MNTRRKRKAALVMIAALHDECLTRNKTRSDQITEAWLWTYVPPRGPWRPRKDSA